MIKIAPEGYPFIGISLLISVIFLLFGLLSSPPKLILNIAFVVSTGVVFFMAFFFRDPERTPPEDRNIFVAPADGKVVLIRNVYEDRYLFKNAIQLSIFMSPLDVHVNRSPADGIVKGIVHNRGRFLAAYRDDASLRNENIEMVLETPFGDILVRQVAGFIARRAVCRVKKGDSLRPGERFGIIKFSSRVDIFLPVETEITVKKGQRVRAGETIIGRIGLESKG